MKLIMFVQLITTCLGWSAVAWTSQGVRIFILPQNSIEEAVGKLREYLQRGSNLTKNTDVYVNGNVNEDMNIQVFSKLLDSKLKRYFSGEIITFDFPIDWRGYTFFQRKVLEMVQLIPYGMVYSYSYLAANMKIPGGARAVGGALRSNRTPLIIPCHRVIRKDGTRGGFSAGPSWKEKLLCIENLKVSNYQRLTDSH